MLTFLRLLLGLALIGVVVALAMIFVPHRPTPPLTTLPADYEIPSGAGEYAMYLGDCAACHTAEGGERFAGGRPIDSPLGTIYSTNITPDPETGIGRYTLDQFRAALYDGIRADGAHLYPAMPYENYRKLTEEDVRALYHYFTEEVAPVHHQGPETSLPFPFNQRWGIRAWNWVALEQPGFRPHTEDPQVARGAYLVEGPGHCGACHTPRNLVMAQDGTDASSKSFLRGGEIDGWTAPDLRGAKSPVALWSAEQLKMLFASGRSAHAAVTGEMSLVVEESTQHWTESDLDAMVAYLKSIADPADPRPVRDPAPTVALLTHPTRDMPLGARLYLDNCGACHFVSGKGADEVFPELDGNFLVNAPSPTGLIEVILHGSTAPSTEIRPYRLRMPDFGHRLSDAEVAELATFLRQAWTNDAAPVTAATVAPLRESRTGEASASN
ncbi:MULTISPECIES: cytochrome c [unclassified Haematobacter]|uniref:cytochrome c n=1 Tax=unclassified Haematobacter TaxID=2640585 RepID=UPI0025BC44B8|nr:MULTISPECIES: cytochrome c [unclassified Haematobacter]